MIKIINIKENEIHFYFLNKEFQLYNNKNEIFLKNIIKKQIGKINFNLENLLFDKTILNIKTKNNYKNIELLWENIFLEKQIKTPFIKDQSLSFNELNFLINLYFKENDLIEKQRILQKINILLESKITERLKYITFLIKGIFLLEEKSKEINIYDIFQEFSFKKQEKINNSLIEIDIKTKLKKDLSVDISVDIKIENKHYFLYKENKLINKILISLFNDLWKTNYTEIKLLKEKQTINKKSINFLLKESDNLNIFKTIDYNLFYKNGYFFNIDFNEESIYNIVLPNILPEIIFNNIIKNLKQNPKNEEI